MQWLNSLAQTVGRQRIEDDIGNNLFASYEVIPEKKKQNSKTKNNKYFMIA